VGAGTFLPDRGALHSVPEGSCREPGGGDHRPASCRTFVRWILPTPLSCCDVRPLARSSFIESREEKDAATRMGSAVLCLHSPDGPWWLQLREEFAPSASGRCHFGDPLLASPVGPPKRRNHHARVDQIALGGCGEITALWREVVERRECTLRVNAFTPRHSRASGSPGRPPPSLLALDPRLYRRVAPRRI
jgi:hypothetical protein